MEKWQEVAMENGWIPMEDVLRFLEIQTQTTFENYETGKRFGIDSKGELLQLQTLIAYFRLYNYLPKEIDSRLKELLDSSRMRMNK